MNDGSTLTFPCSSLGPWTITPGEKLGKRGWIVLFVKNTTPQKMASKKSFRTKGEAAGWIAGLLEQVPELVKLTDWSQVRPHIKLINELDKNPPPAIRAPKGPKKPKQKTYRQAQDDILDYLEDEGWSLRTGLKVPHATSPRSDFRVYFKKQAVYYVVDVSPGYTQAGNLPFQAARSMWVDIRKTDGPAFLREVDKMIAIERKHLDEDRY